MISVLSVGQTISGIIVDKSKKDTLPYVTVKLLDSSATKIIITDFSDVDGKFKFKHVKEGYYCIKTSDIVYGDSIFRNIKIYDDTLLILDIHKLCKYDNSINDKKCPICHKTNKVIPICYGLPITIDEKPKKRRIKSLKECYFAGCQITHCDPHWYCKRDKTKF